MIEKNEGRTSYSQRQAMLAMFVVSALVLLTAIGSAWLMLVGAAIGIAIVLLWVKNPQMEWTRQ